MRFTLATTIIALAVLTKASPHPVEGVAIPISKRSGLTNTDKTVNIEALDFHVASTRAYVSFFLYLTSTQTLLRSKVLRGLSNFHKNTGVPHPSVSKGAQKRASAAEQLTDDNSQLWFGSITAGSPPNTFTGELSCTVAERVTHSVSQWTLTQVRGM